MRCTPKNRVARAACITICTLGCLAILAIIILVIIIAATFKLPDVTVNRVGLAPNQQISFNTAQQGAFRVAWEVSVSVRNSNIYDIYLSSGTVNSEFKTLPGQTVASGTFADQNLPANNATTEFKLPVTIDLDPTSAANSKILQELVRSCTVGGTGRLSMVYKVDVWAKVYGLGPVKVPTITREADTDCPTTLNVNNVLRQVGISI